MGLPLLGLGGRQARVAQLAHDALGIGGHVIKALAQQGVVQHQGLPGRPLHGLAALVQRLCRHVQRGRLGGAGLALAHQGFEGEHGPQGTGAQQPRNQQEGEQQQLLKRWAVRARLRGARGVWGHAPGLGGQAVRAAPSRTSTSPRKV